MRGEDGVEVGQRAVVAAEGEVAGAALEQGPGVVGVRTQAGVEIGDGGLDLAQLMEGASAAARIAGSARQRARAASKSARASA